jgi:hypothetical protein
VTRRMGYGSAKKVLSALASKRCHAYAAVMTALHASEEFNCVADPFRMMRMENYVVCFSKYVHKCVSEFFDNIL